MVVNSGLVRGFGDQYDPADFGNVFVVGLAGLRGSGKSTVAALLCEELLGEGFDAVQISFAGRINDMVNTLVGSSQWEKDDLLYGDSDWDVRQFLMQFGTEFVRDNLGKNFWVDVVAQQIFEQESSVVVIDDMRFLNEYIFIQALGVGVLIERDGVGSYFGIHRSEMPDTLGISDVVSNNSSVSDAVRAVRDIVRRNQRCPF